MAYPSVGEAAAVGLERGVSISRGLREDEERRKDREEARGLRKQQLAAAEEERTFQRGRQARADVVGEEGRALKAAEAELAAARDAFGGLQQSGASAEDLHAADAEGQRIAREVQSMRRRLFTPLWQEKEKSSKTLLEDLKTRRKSPQDIPESELYGAISTALRRPANELYRNEDGSPSQLGAAANQLVESMQSGDSRSMLQAANVVFAPELQVGVGEIVKGGVEIIKKEIVAARGDPRGNGRVMPTLLVTGRTPDGREVRWHAPITEGRTGSGDDDRAVSLDVGDVLDHVARIQATEQVVNSPEAAEYLRRGENEAQPQVKNSLYWYRWAGGKDVKPKEIKTETIQRGGLVTRIKTEPGGKETREDMPVTLKPGDLSAAEKKEIELAKAKRPRGGGAGGGGALGPEEKRDRLIEKVKKEKGMTDEQAYEFLRKTGRLGIQSPEERAEAAAARAEAAAKEADVRAGQRQAPGTAPSQVRVEIELKAKALNDPSIKNLPSGWKFGKFVPGKGLPIMGPDGKQLKDANGNLGWYR